MRVSALFLAVQGTLREKEHCSLRIRKHEWKEACRVLVERRIGKGSIRTRCEV